VRFYWTSQNLKMIQPPSLIFLRYVVQSGWQSPIRLLPVTSVIDRHRVWAHRYVMMNCWTHASAYKHKDKKSKWKLDFVSILVPARSRSLYFRPFLYFSLLFTPSLSLSLSLSVTALLAKCRCSVFSCTLR
jgi:hypothetical protein